MQKVYILSGPSGCGKSTFANSLKEKLAAVVCSADDFFTDDEGVYVFDPTKIAEAHSHCFAKFVEHLQYDVPIVIDNTNLEWWKRQNYYNVAKLAGREVEVHSWRVVEVRHIFELAARNKHGVSAELIFRMVARQTIDAGSYSHTIDERL